MIVGRFVGVFTAIGLIQVFHFSAISWVVIAIIGTILGLVVSSILGPMFLDKNRPTKYDTLEYWTDLYGDELGLDAYKAWLEEA